MVKPFRSVRLLLLALPIALSTITSCTSPLDLDTPRESIVDSTGTPLQIISSALTLDDPDPRDYACTIERGSVDTSNGVPKVSLRLRGTPAADPVNPPTVSEIRLSLRDLPADGIEHGVIGNPDDAEGASVYVTSGVIGNEWHQSTGGDDELRIALTPSTEGGVIDGTISVRLLVFGRPLIMQGTITIRYQH